MQQTIEPELLNQAFELIKKSKKIGIVSHRSPDADTIGANVALKMAIEPWGAKATSLCIDPVPENCQFLPQTQSFKQDFNYDDFDLYIFVDCGASYMSKYQETKPELLSKKTPIINIDHHNSNDNFGNLNLVMPKAASTTYMLWLFFVNQKIIITPHIATALMAGLYFDTGSFQHDNVTAEVLKCASDLTQKKANIELITYNLLKQTSLNKLKLWGRVLSRAKLNEKQIASSVITNEDIKETGANSKDSEGLIDYLTTIKGNKFAILLKEDEQGGIKGSLRTQTDIDVSAIASIFGGGGHKKASGFRVEGKLKSEMNWFIN
jgi:phosphoesterase RecJ-like protein